MSLVGPAVCSGTPEPPRSATAKPAYLGDQLGSFLLSHSHWLLCSAPPDISLMVWRRACPLIPISPNGLTVDVAMKPSTSNFYWEDLCSVAPLFSPRWKLCVSQLFYFVGSCTASSQGTELHDVYHALMRVGPQDQIRPQVGDGYV